MSAIPIEKAEDAFRRFFPDDWEDRLTAWLAAQSRSVSHTSSSVRVDPVTGCFPEDGR
jgi:hypothetical protein